MGETGESSAPERKSKVKWSWIIYTAIVISFHPINSCINWNYGLVLIFIIRYHKGANTAVLLRVSLMWRLDPTEQNPFNKYLWTCCFLLLNSLCYGLREPRTAPLQGEAVVWLQPSLSSVGLVVSVHWKATWSWMERGWMRTKRHSVQGGSYSSSKYCPTFHLSSLYLIALVLLV